MDPDTLIPIAVNYAVAIFFLVAPLLLARRWFPAATRLAESIAWPVIIVIVAAAVLQTLLPYLAMAIVSALVITVGVGAGLALLRHHSGRRRHKGSGGRGRPGRHPVVRRPSGRRRQSQRSR